jgi:hypothetical protein
MHFQYMLTPGVVCSPAKSEIVSLAGDQYSRENDAEKEKKDYLTHPDRH